MDETRAPPIVQGDDDMSGKGSNMKIPDWRDVDPKLRDRVIAELDEWKWEAAPSDRKLALALASAAAALHRLTAQED